MEDDFPLNFTVYNYNQLSNLISIILEREVTRKQEELTNVQNKH